MTGTLTQSICLGTVDSETRFNARDGRLWLARLCGMPIGRDGEDTGPARTQGVALIQADGGRFEGGDLTLESMNEAVPALEGRWRVGSTALRLTTTWCVDAVTGVVSRKDLLVNPGDKPTRITRCLARMTLSSGNYECYTQTSRWCRENQGAWQPLLAGLTLRHASGRTTEEGTPYLAIRADNAGHGLIFHVLPCGNWTIRVSSVNEGGGLPYAVVELGLADENLCRVLAPGESWALPEILIQALPDGEPNLGAPVLHRYLLSHFFACAKPEVPVVYNTWFDQFEILDVPRLRAQLAAAKAVGCEVFVIDAGWYGAGGPNWWAQAGDWREKTETAFEGRMGDFAAEVRAAGLGFGLWMEPERFGPEAPIRAEHPEWFVPVGGAARIDLTCPPARAWLRGEMGRLVETYGLAWMKIDFNFTMDIDASGVELYDYTTAWYRLLDEIRTAYPSTFFEGCSSGAMRGDLATLAHFDSHFLSDSVNPVDMLRISQGAWLRLPPGRNTRWAVLRPAGQVIPRYGKRLEDSPPMLLTPCGAGWEPSETVDLNFALLAAMPGMMGMSGDLAGLAPEHRQQIGAAIAFYKSWRRFITGAVVHLLTPTELLSRREGWVMIQLQGTDTDTSLIFVFRLGFAGSPPPLRLRGLLADERYRVWSEFDAAATSCEYSGEVLLHEGIPLSVAGSLAAPGNGAVVYSVQRIN